jgi:transposase-like protein
MDITNDAGPQTLLEAVRYFADPKVAHDFFVAQRWPNGVTCPTCGSDAVAYMSRYQRWVCREKHPRRQFSAKVGNIFEDSPLGFDKWLPAMWMMLNCENGVSSYEIHRALGITQKSAWHMLHRLRLVTQTGSFMKLAGDVEVDETFIGGKARFMHKGKRQIKGTGMVGKTAVMGLLERHGPDGKSKVRVKVIPTTKKSQLQAEVRANVEPGANLDSDALGVLRRARQGLHPPGDRPCGILRAREGPHQRPGELLVAAQARDQGDVRQRGTVPSVPVSRRAGVPVQ